MKKRRWCAWDSNTGPQDGRRRQNHGAMAAIHFKCIFANSKVKEVNTGSAPRDAPTDRANSRPLLPSFTEHFGFFFGHHSYIKITSVASQKGCMPTMITTDGLLPHPLGTLSHLEIITSKAQFKACPESRKQNFFSNF